ncbi:hypothetical protein N0M98_30045 [Paenibacillus doosanensis]|uniref:hypothetical protein n=1 Tax=Paenibacillus doosanensis TaxID=1229154 RepID=UPI00217F7DA4|nr:hypothetical protein [Paenibacillus doosanensis]MCS7464350.1 hypothetical protein [Paenibacillus doosanensis]
MKKATAALLLAAALLSACSKAAPAQSGHEGMDMSSSDHGAHAGHEIGETAKAAAVKAAFSFKPERPQAGKDTNVSIQISDSAGNPVDKFDVSHEQQMHLIVVSKDLSYFEHIHPAYQGKGVFDVTAKLPVAGEYKLFADFVPSGQGSVTRSQWVTVQGNAPKPQPIQPDASLTKTADGKEVTLATGKLEAGKEASLTFTIKDAATKQPITNLQPYLGAVGHVVILSDDAEQYLHVHPMEEKASGPDAKFMTTFPKSGVYKVWGQFQHEGKVFTVPFVVKVSS